MTSIGTSAFYKCSDLGSVTIGSGVMYISSGAFSNCEKLETVTCLAEKVPSISSSDIFNNSYVEYATLRVPDQSVVAYNSVYPWKNFGKIVGISNGESVEKCATPTINFGNGQITATSATEGAVCHIDYKINGTGTAANSLSVTGSITVTAYATAEGYVQSEKATETFDLKQLGGNENQAELKALQKELAEKKAEIVSLQSDIEQKNGEINNLKKQLEVVNGEKTLLLAQIEAKEVEIKGLKNELSTLKASAEELERTIAQLKEENTSLNQSINILAVSNSQLKAEVEGLRGDVATLQQINEELKESNEMLKDTNEALKQSNALLTESNERQNAELAENAETIASLKAENATLSDELSLYCLGDMNKDGKTDLEDVVMLLTMDSYSGDSDALAQLAEETSITLTQIDERYGDVEYYKLNGVKVDKPTQPGVYLVKKDGQTKMIVVRK